jgi:hypothetical protein
MTSPISTSIRKNSDESIAERNNLLLEWFEDLLGPLEICPNDLYLSRVTWGYLTFEWLLHQKDSL